jgi:RND family efflux transporter MFP subunit
MQADLEAGEARVARTERLAQIGAASQQELEGARADHTRHRADVEHAAAKLRLFGVDPAQVTHPTAAGSASATVRMTAPQEGVVLERPATVGMSVDPATVLVTLVDLSPVWVIADVYEGDFAAVRVGSRATITTEAYPGPGMSGKVTYVSPEVRAETRTADVRVEVDNPAGRLRFGMFVNVTLEGVRRPSGPIVPRAAVQTIDARTVVYVALDESAGRFEERPVVLGPEDQERIPVISGLAPGDRVVTTGSFALRAEAERQGLRPSVPAAAAPAVRISTPSQPFDVRVTAGGFEPNTLTLRAGSATRITFTRTTNETCATEVVLPDYGIRKSLPLNQPVTVEFVAKREGAAGFVCGMNMLKGTLVVR